MLLYQNILEWFNKHQKSSAEVSSSKKLVPKVENLMNERLQVAKRLEVTEINSYRFEYKILGLDGLLMWCIWIGKRVVSSILI